MSAVAIDFAAARRRIEALAAKHECVEVELKPSATLIERIHLVHGDATAEVLAIAIEECK